jgi:hypothetical protein
MSDRLGVDTGRWGISRVVVDNLRVRIAFQFREYHAAMDQGRASLLRDKMINCLAAVGGDFEYRFE